MIDFFSGALTITFLISGVYFLRFWRQTRDRLFLNFALAFWLMAMDQFVISRLSTTDERSGYAYFLRVLGFVLILFAIVDKNLFRWSKKR